MPLMGGARKRSRGNVEQPDGTRLEGWNFVQEKMLSHDEDMISDYADDIDTLLVFAGLFSAVLTAFLVVSLVLLQPDNSQTTNQILSVIALQNDVPPPMQPFLRATAESLPTSTAFTAPKDVATINTLWFSSLVLSLAAALFGILAKQWCREYLRWHSAILSPRENVLIRQVRFEAWDRWRVGAFIAFIPAFLEIALVLFLVGLLIFVPTYSERSMTIVLSVVIGSVLLGVVVLTILPVFFRLCPFQTPTGWAFVRLAKPMRRVFWWLARRVSIVSDWVFIHMVTSIDEPKWSICLWNHSRAMLRCVRAEEVTNWRAYGLHSVKNPELCTPLPAAVDIEQACRDIHTDFDDAAVDAVQTSTLFRALTWVRLGSNDETVLAAIQEAVPTIHATISTTNVEDKPQFLSAIHAICPTDVSTVLKLVRACFYGITEGSLSFRIRLQSPFDLLDIFGPFVDTQCHRLEEPHGAVCGTWANHSASLEVSHALILRELLSLVDDWLSLLAGTATEERRTVAKRIAVLLCVLRILPSEATRQSATDAGMNLTLPWAETLEEVYRKLAPHKAAYEDGLVSMSVEVCRLLGPLKFGREQGEKYSICIDKNSLCQYDIVWEEVSWKRECILVSTWATLAVNIYHNINNYEDANGRHLFVALVSRVFETMRLRIKYKDHVINSNETIEPMAELLSCLVDALRWSLVHSHPNCGAYVSLPWVRDIVQYYQAANSTKERLRDENPVRYRLLKFETYSDPLTGNKALEPNFLLILRLLQTCLERKLLTGETTAANFEELLTLLDMKVEDLPELPADLISGTSPTQQAAVQPLRISYDTSEPEPESEGLSADAIAGWLRTPRNAPTGATSVELMTARTHSTTKDTSAIVEVEDASSGRNAEARSRVDEGGDLAPAGTHPEPPHSPASSADERPQDAEVTESSSSRLVDARTEPAVHLQSGSLLTPPQRSGDRYDERAGPKEIHAESPPQSSTSSPTNPRSDIPQSETPILSTTPDPNDGPSSFEREPALRNTHTAADFSYLQAASGHEPTVVADPPNDDRDMDTMLQPVEPAMDTGDESAHTVEMEGDAYPLHTLTLSRTRDDGPAGVVHRDDLSHTRLAEAAEHQIQLQTRSSTASSPNTESKTRGEQSNTTVAIDDTDRDLEAGPRIPSPVGSEGRGEV